MRYETRLKRLEVNKSDIKPIVLTLEEWRGEAPEEARRRQMGDAPIEESQLIVFVRRLSEPILDGR